MKIILKQDVDPIGIVGEIADVSNGYARNYLIPKGIAIEATTQNIKLTEMQRKKIETKRLKAREDAERLRENLGEILITISQKAGEEGKLFGSVTSMDIATHLEKHGVVIDKRKIVLDKSIKHLGEFEIPVKLYPGVTGSVRVTVVPI